MLTITPFVVISHALNVGDGGRSYYHSYLHFILFLFFCTATEHFSIAVDLLLFAVAAEIFGRTGGVVRCQPCAIIKIIITTTTLIDNRYDIVLVTLLFCLFSKDFISLPHQYRDRVSLLVRRCYRPRRPCRVFPCGF
jgi:hypothetical protein